MIGVVLTMPDDPAALPTWLEDRLLSPDLPQLVAELTVLHGHPTGTQGAKLLSSLADVLGRDADSVLDLGLTALPQSAAFADASTTEVASGTAGPGAECGRPIFGTREAAMTTWPGGPFTLPAASAQPWHSCRQMPSPERPGAGGRMPSRPWLRPRRCYSSSISSVFVPRTERHRNSRRQTGALPGSTSCLVTPAMTRFSPNSLTWPRNGLTRGRRAQEGLAQRLGQFRQGCAALQLADNLPLSAPQRQWLRLRLRRLGSRLRRPPATTGRDARRGRRPGCRRQDSGQNCAGASRTVSCC